MQVEITKRLYKTIHKDFRLIGVRKSLQKPWTDSIKHDNKYAFSLVIISLITDHDIPSFMNLKKVQLDDLLFKFTNKEVWIQDV